MDCMVYNDTRRAGKVLATEAQQYTLAALNASQPQLRRLGCKQLGLILVRSCQSHPASKEEDSCANIAFTLSPIPTLTTCRKNDKIACPTSLLREAG